MNNTQLKELIKVLQEKKQLNIALTKKELAIFTLYGGVKQWVQ